MYKFLILTVVVSVVAFNIVKADDEIPKEAMDCALTLKPHLQAVFACAARTGAKSIEEANTNCKAESSAGEADAAKCQPLFSALTAPQTAKLSALLASWKM